MISGNVKLIDSYHHCKDIAKQRAANFYYSFLVLPREKGDAMCAVYAFMRCCDDIADEPGIGKDRKRMLERWRESLDNAMKGNYGNSRILPAFHDTVKRYSIPIHYFHDLIDGASMDLSLDHYDTFDQLYDYCYKVASVVGLVCIHIFGFDSPEAKRYAEYCGIGFQLTNILRDVKEDARMGRVYLPGEDLWAFDYSSEDLKGEVCDDRFLKLIKFEAQRARSYYNAAWPLLDLIHESGRPGLCAMMRIYSAILEKIEKRPGEVLANRITLSKPRKLGIAAKAFFTATSKGGRQYRSAQRS